MCIRDRFPIGSVLINRLMTALAIEINASSILSRRLFSVEFLTTLSGDALITLLYHRKLDDEWQSAAEALQQRLGVAIIGRSRKQKITLGRDYVLERLHVDNKYYQYQQVEGGFTQPNADINQNMLSWSLDKTSDCGGDLLELYCGNGNLPVSWHKTLIVCWQQRYLKSQCDRQRPIYTATELIM